jgi:hypothetical protein
MIKAIIKRVPYRCACQMWRAAEMPKAMAKQMAAAKEGS